MFAPKNAEEVLLAPKIGGCELSEVHLPDPLCLLSGRRFTLGHLSGHARTTEPFRVLQAWTGSPKPSKKRCLLDRGTFLFPYTGARHEGV